MIFIDTNIFMYAAGSAHPNKEPCVRFIKKLAKAHSSHQYCTNTEVLQEILHRYRSIDLADKGYELFDNIINLGLVIHPVDIQDLKFARRVLQSHSLLSTRDAVHIGVAVRRGITKIVSYDKDFERYGGIERVELK